jgi:multisubunit Na+/H+ antiporter MnhB subunit
MNPESTILRTVARFAVPLTILASILVFFQGHNLPGGGFIGGVLAAAAGATYLLAFGIERAGAVAWWRLAVVGLAISLASGIVPWVLESGFLNHALWHFDVPLLGEIHFSSATFFDLGVYLIVVGTLMTIFVELGLEAR